MFGKFFHLMVDAVLISIALSGIKRSTGLTPAVRRLPNKDLRSLFRVYLETGEWVSRLRNPVIISLKADCSALAFHPQLMDLSVVALGRSNYFERIR
jgi:hypothetical protein